MPKKQPDNKAIYWAIGIFAVIVLIVIIFYFKQYPVQLVERKMNCELILHWDDIKDSLPEGATDDQIAAEMVRLKLSCERVNEMIGLSEEQKKQICQNREIVWVRSPSGYAAIQKQACDLVEGEPLCCEAAPQGTEVSQEAQNLLNDWCKNSFLAPQECEASHTSPMWYKGNIPSYQFSGEICKWNTADPDCFMTLSQQRQVATTPVRQSN